MKEAVELVECVEQTGMSYIFAENYCYMSAPDAKFGEMSYEDCMKLIDQMAECGISRIGLTGGEPIGGKARQQLLDRLSGEEGR